MNRLIKVIATLAALAGLMLVSTGCSTVSTEPDEVALHYSGGSFSSKNFKDCVEASKRSVDGPGDTHYIYPKGQRTFSFTGAEGSEQGPITVTTNDGQNLSVPGFVTFTLDTDCKTLRAFHEKIGIKYKAYRDGGGWDDFLNDYIAVPLTSAMNKASLGGGWFDLYSKAEVQAKFEEYVKENLPDEVQKALGEDFITINAVQISKPKPSEELTNALAAKEQARIDNEAQVERNKVAKTKYDSQRECRSAGLSEEACLIIYLAETGKVPFYPLPAGGNINISPPSAG